MRTLPLLLVPLLLLPGAAAHGAPAVLDVEQQLLADEASDLTYAYDGYDLTALYVREAYWMPLDQHGLVFRILAAGGLTPAATASALHIDLGLEAGGETHAFRFTTTDDETWTGDLEILEALAEADADLPATTANLQVFLPLDLVGVQSGDEVGGFTLHAWADDNLVDAAPGGLYLPGAGDAAEVPQDSTRTKDSVALEGPAGYTSTNLTQDGETVTFEVENLLSVSGQHVFVLPAEAAAWTLEAEGDNQASLSEAHTHPFAFRVGAAGHDSLPVRIVTDLGGLETLYLNNVDGGYTLTAEPMPGDHEHADEAEAPGVGPVLLLVALAALGVAARRR